MHQVAERMTTRPVTVRDREQARFDLAGRRQFALCGFAESSRALMPRGDPRWVVAGMNQLYQHLPSADVWFDMHSYWREGNVEGTDHVGWLLACGIPVLMAQVEPDVPTSVRFPLERSIGSGADYFTSTASYMVAWALDCIQAEVERELQQDDARHERSLWARYTIALFGIDLVADDEYAHQRPCLEFWLGRASALGVRLLIPKTSALLRQSHRYGYEREPDLGLLKLSELKARGAELDTEIQASLANTERLAGRRDEQLYWQSVIEVRLRGGNPATHLIRKG